MSQYGDWVLEIIKNSDSKICYDIESKIDETNDPDLIPDIISQGINVICYNEGIQGENITINRENKRLAQSRKKEKNKVVRLF